MVLIYIRLMANDVEHLFLVFDMTNNATMDIFISRNLKLIPTKEFFKAKLLDRQIFKKMLKNNVILPSRIVPTSCQYTPYSEENKIKIELPQISIHQEINQLKSPLQGHPTFRHAFNTFIKHIGKKENSFTFMGNVTQIFLHFRKLWWGFRAIGIIFLFSEI